MTERTYLGWRRPGQLINSLLLAGSWLWLPALLGASDAYDTCLAAAGVPKGHGSDHPDLCSGQSLGLLLAGMSLVVILVVELALGVIRGLDRARRGGRLIASDSAAVVVLLVLAVVALAPWFGAVYALCWLIGRRSGQPAPGPAPDPVWALGWDRAVELGDHLRGEGALPDLDSAFLAERPVRLETTFRYARHYGTQPVLPASTVLAFGRPGFVLGALAVRTMAHRSAVARARALAAEQWRDLEEAPTVITDHATWCRVRGRWLRFEHAAVAEYRVTGFDVMITFRDVEPLLLTGPDAWRHAVLFAYLTLGPDEWQQAPWVQALTAYSLNCEPPEENASSGAVG